MLYASPDFATSLIETIVRDRFIRHQKREIMLQEVVRQAWALISTKPEAELTLLDLRRNGCALAGIPTDTVNARNHAAGRALGKNIYEHHSTVDGFLYTSRLTGTDIYAVFDRGIDKLEWNDSGVLTEHPELPDVLRRYSISLILER